ncbi:DUF2974 domain-containing protein [bacterium]|nr:DUF2974 domain-containing protein [bacterium]
MLVSKPAWTWWLWVALVVLPCMAVEGGKGIRLGPDHWGHKMGVFQGQGPQMLLDAQFRRATARQGPYAQLGRISQDYAYNLPNKPDDERLLRRLLSDNLIPLETYRSPDGTAGVVLKNIKTGQIIISFRGTTGDLLKSEDWLRNEAEGGAGQSTGTVSYALHHKVFDQWAERYSKEGKLVVTGHSRGGGLAQIFTSFHGDKVALTATHQAPGVDDTTHQRYAQIPVTQRGQNIAFVADNDCVSDVGGDHLGQPKVFLFNGKDTASSDHFAGHTSTGSQPEGLTDCDGNLYRNPGDGRLITTLDYFEYKSQVRGGSILNLLKAAGKVREGMELSPVDPKYIQDYIRRHGRAPEDSEWSKIKMPDPEIPSAVLQVSVRDKETNQVLAGAQIQAPGCSSSTDQDGLAILNLPRPKGDRFSVSVSCPGYQSRQGTVQIRQDRARAAVALEPLLKVRLNGPTQSQTGQKGTYRATVAGGIGPYQYRWMLDGTPQDANSDQVTVTWAEAGGKRLAVEVKDNRGISRRKSLFIQVAAGPLVAQLLGPERVQLTDTSQYQVAISGGVPPYRMQWSVDGENANLSEDSTSAVMNWSVVGPGQHTFQVVVTDRAGTQVQAHKTVQLEAANVAVQPGAANYAPVSGSYTGTLEKRMEDKSLKSYPGLRLNFDGQKVGGVIQCDRDQGMILELRFSGEWRNFRKAGESVSRRQLAGEIRGTVNGVHPVQGQFFVTAASAGQWSGSWNLTFKSGDQWRGRFHVQH